MQDLDFITAHEAQQRAAVNAPLYSTHAQCAGACHQGRSLCMTPALCQRATADAADAWEPTSVADNLSFWVLVLFCTGLFVLGLLFLAGWRP